jgi:hypothetical protein
MVEKEYNRRDLLTNSAVLGLVGLGATGTTGVAGAQDSENVDFRVEIQETNAPIIWGENLEFSVEVSNEGYDDDKQNLNYSVVETGPSGRTIETGGTGLDLDGWGSTTQSFSVGTEMNDVNREVKLSVSTEDRADARTMSFKETLPADIEPAIINLPESFVESEAFSFDVGLENQGHREGTRKYAVSVDGSTVVKEKKTLGWLEAITETVTVPAEALAPGAQELSVRTTEETAQGEQERYTESATITVQEAATFQISSLQVESAFPGQPIRVNTRLSNNGDVDGEGALEVEIADIGAVSESLTIPSGESQSLTLELSTDSVDVGEYEGTITTPTETRDITVDLRAPEVQTSVETNSPVSPSGTLDVTVTLTNNEDAEVTTDLVVRSDDLGEKTSTVTIPTNEQAEQTLSFNSLGDLSEGTYTLQVVAGGTDFETEVEIATDASDGENGDGGSSDGGDDGSSSSSGDGGDDAQGPGFGIPGGAAGVASAAYLLKQRLDDDDESGE